MPPIVMAFIGFGAGLLTMTVVSFYKWVFKRWNKDI